MWERTGGGGLLPKQIPRHASDAITECARIASEQALGKLAEQSRAQPNQATVSNHDRKNGHDWTGFWKSVKDMGLDQQGVLHLAEGLMPRKWLKLHPDHDLEDLLDMLRWKWEQWLSPHPAIGMVEAS